MPAAAPAPFDPSAFKDAVRALVAKIGFVPAPANIPEIAAALDLDTDAMAAVRAAVRGILAAAGVSPVPDDMPGIAAALAANAAAAVQAMDLYRSLLGEASYTSVFNAYGADDLSGWLPLLVEYELVLDIAFPDALSIGGDWTYGTEYSASVRIAFPVATAMESEAFRDGLVSGIDLSAPELLAIPDRAFEDSGYGGGSISLAAPKAGSVGAYAFAGRYLDDVVLPSVLSVGNYAFDSASGDIGLPSATDVGANAFYNFSGGHVDLPAATQVDESAFSAAMYLEVGLGSLTVAQVEAARWFGCMDEYATFYCSDGETSPEV